MLSNLKPASTKIVNVAIAVIYYQDKYLLGFRHHAQHQGNKYEFIGGKIEANETATKALIREVGEEVGIDISANAVFKLGRLHHDYGDKQVCLQVYKVALTDTQFTENQHKSCGLEGQALIWADKNELLSGVYPLPAANKTILTWLQLPTQIVITYPLAHFTAKPNATAAWLTYHQQHLPQQAWVYLRIKLNESTDVSDESPLIESQLMEQLLTLRPDIQSIVPHNNNASFATNAQCKAYHLTQTELMNNVLRDYVIDRPLLISCHDADSIQAANQLAASRLTKQQSPVIGIFLSPVLATQTHPNEQPLGWKAWSILAQLADMPVIALGGLSPSMYQQATNYGATSIAGIRQFMSS
ncbi:NUDIX domain-containing protein [Psychrobacter sp. 16-MNA-CIBAN-0192]|uniref:NUDIX domain-containing protein n=1 Tax=Psychrobacter sp. 16-MNA-CIBAN-0192 TaxID=3140448 RepID=UPI0033254005